MHSRFKKSVAGHAKAAPTVYMSWNLVDLIEMTYSYPVAQSANDDKDHWAAAASSDLAPML